MLGLWALGLPFRVQSLGLGMQDDGLLWHVSWVWSHFFTYFRGVDECLEGSWIEGVQHCRWPTDFGSLGAQAEPAF